MASHPTDPIITLPYPYLVYSKLPNWKKTKRIRDFNTRIGKIRPWYHWKKWIGWLLCHLFKAKRLAISLPKNGCSGEISHRTCLCPLAGKAYNFRQTNNVTGISKLPPPRKMFRQTQKRTLKKKKLLILRSKPRLYHPLRIQWVLQMRLPPPSIYRKCFECIRITSELGQKAYLDGSYTSALLHARDALKENSQDAQAWKLLRHTSSWVKRIRLKWPYWRQYVINHSIWICGWTTFGLPVKLCPVNDICRSLKRWETFSLTPPKFSGNLPAVIT